MSFSSSAAVEPIVDLSFCFDDNAIRFEIPNCCSICMLVFEQKNETNDSREFTSLSRICCGGKHAGPTALPICHETLLRILHANPRKSSDVKKHTLANVWRRFCVKCFEKLLLQHIRKKDSFFIYGDQGRFGLTCPVCCTRELTLDTCIIRNVLRESLCEEIERAFKPVAAQHGRVLYCPVAGCSNCIRYDKSLPVQTVFDCKEHGKTCALCWKTIEIGKSGEERHLNCARIPDVWKCEVADLKLRRCPMCLIAIEVYSGCSKVSCSNCWSAVDLNDFPSVVVTPSSAAESEMATLGEVKTTTTTTTTKKKMATATRGAELSSEKIENNTNNAHGNDDDDNDNDDDDNGKDDGDNDNDDDDNDNDDDDKK